ncbi:SepM family pheromone-processing serine protease [Lysinibacillus sp. 54212]|uniref:SepM family pheromone-processing serine protease n=1 Tax=Lysinibacillus sp. 54212 TaxID=3119829 RepID=UPI002FC62EDD
MKKINWTYALTSLLTLIMVAFLLLYPMDYYIMKPGSAYNVEEFVTVQQGDRDDTGSLNLMTVSMSRATPFKYIVAKFRDYQDILDMNDVRQEEEDDEEYNIRQLKLMSDSKFNALYVAFSRANLDYHVTYKGVYVLNIISGGAADGILKPGDEIVEIDGARIQNQQMLIDEIGNRQSEDKISLVINRDDKLLTKTIALKEIPGSQGKKGLGITFNESKTIKTDPKVNMDTEDIGGPSAGLMFTLEILNQLVDEDLTKGYTVAGTGEMYENGTVGRIGGVEKKVVAAHEDGMEIFFAPDDEITDAMLKMNPNILSNYEAAVLTAKKIGTKMKIVPVKTIDDALDYLAQLQPKN